MTIHTPQPTTIIAPIYRDHGAPNLILSERVLSALCAAMDRVAKADTAATRRRGTLPATQAPRGGGEHSHQATIALMLANGPMMNSALRANCVIPQSSIATAISAHRKHDRIRGGGNNVPLTLTPKGWQWLVDMGYASRDQFGGMLLDRTERSIMAVIGAIRGGATTSSEIAAMIGRTTELVLMRTAKMADDGLIERVKAVASAGVGSQYVFSITDAGRAWMEARA